MGENCPWIVQAGKESYEWEPIATLGDCLEDGPSRRSKVFQRIQADARLIASAPELLEALEWALAELSGETRYDEDVADQQCDACYARAYAALSKARGQ